MEVLELSVTMIWLGKVGWLTEETICQGSRNTIEMKIQRTYVDKSDTIKVKNI